jgi:hypothetical protein
VPLNQAQERQLDGELARIQALREQAEAARQRDDSRFGSQVAQLQSARQELEKALSNVVTLAETLKRDARRGGASEVSNLYLVFANGHLRMAGAVSQALRRTSSVDRLLVAARAEQEDRARRDREEENWRQERAANRRVQELMTADDDVFNDLFGEEFDDAP